MVILALKTTTHSNDDECLAQKKKKGESFAVMGNKESMLEALVIVSANGADSLPVGIIWMASSCNYDILALMVGSGSPNRLVGIG